MSDYKAHSGKIKKVEPRENEDFEQLCKRLWIENGKTEDSYDKNELFDEFYKKYLKINKTEVWEIIEHKELDASDSFCNLNDNKDGTFSFNTRFYNGGTYLQEMIQDSLNKLNKSS